MSNTQKSIVLALTSAFALSMATTTVNATNNPFAAKTLTQGYQVADSDMKAKDGKCGTGKCGASKSEKATEASCGKDKAAEGKCSAEKAKEGKCSADKAKEGKCSH